ncbi:MAG: hypothetical protein ACE366_02550 [Bradymonadia bacterium]
MADKVLIIDADLTFGEQLQQAIERLGVSAETTVNDEEGLRLAQGDDVAAVLVGLMDEKGSGYGLVTRLRRKLPELPIAMILEEDELGADRLKRHKGLRNRADQYLIRPLVLGEFAEALGQLVNKSLQAPEGSADETLGASDSSFEGVRLFDDDELEELGAGLSLGSLGGDAGEIELDDDDVELEAIIETEALESDPTGASAVTASIAIEDQGTMQLPAITEGEEVGGNDEITPIPVELDEDDEEPAPALTGPMDVTVMQSLSDEQMATLEALGGTPAPDDVPNEGAAEAEDAPEDVSENVSDEPSTPIPAERLVSRPTGEIPLARDNIKNTMPTPELDEVQDLMDDLNSVLDDDDDDPGPEGVAGVSVHPPERLGSPEHTHAESLARQNAQLANENRRLKTKTTGLEQQLTTLREELSQKRSERSSARQGDANTRRALLETRDTLNRKEREILELREQITQKEMSNLELTDELEGLRDEHNTLQRQLKTLEARSTAGQGALDEADKELERVRVELADVKLTHEESVEAARETESRLTNDIARMEQEHTIALASVEAKAARAAQVLDQEQRTARSTQARLERQLTETEKARDELKTQLDRVNADHATMIEGVADERDAHKSRADAAENEVERLTGELKASQDLLEEESKAASDAQAALEARLADEQKGRADDVAERDARAADLQAQLSELQSQNAAQDRSIEGLNDEIRARDARLRGRAATIRALEERVGDLEGHIKALGETRAEALAALDAVQLAYQSTQSLLLNGPKMPPAREIPTEGGPLTPLPEAMEGEMEIVESPHEDAPHEDAEEGVGETVNAIDSVDAPPADESPSEEESAEEESAEAAVTAQEAADEASADDVEEDPAEEPPEGEAGDAAEDAQLAETGADASEEDAGEKDVSENIDIEIADADPADDAESAEANERAEDDEALEILDESLEPT